MTGDAGAQSKTGRPGPCVLGAAGMVVPGASAPGGGLSGAPSPSSVPGTFQGRRHFVGVTDSGTWRWGGGALLVIWAVTSRVLKRGKRSETLPPWGERPGHAAIEWGRVRE